MNPSHQSWNQGSRVVRLSSSAAVFPKVIFMLDETQANTRGGPAVRRERVSASVQPLNGPRAQNRSGTTAAAANRTSRGCLRGITAHPIAHRRNSPTISSLARRSRRKTTRLKHPRPRSQPRLKMYIAPAPKLTLRHRGHLGSNLDPLFFSAFGCTAPPQTNTITSSRISIGRNTKKTALSRH